MGNFCEDHSFDSSGNAIGIIHVDVACRDGNNIGRFGATIGSIEGFVVAAAMHDFVELICLLFV